MDLLSCSIKIRMKQGVGDKETLGHIILRQNVGPCHNNHDCLTYLLHEHGIYVSACYASIVYVQYTVRVCWKNMCSTCYYTLCIKLVGMEHRTSQGGSGLCWIVRVWPQPQQNRASWTSLWFSWRESRFWKNNQLHWSHRERLVCSENQLQLQFKHVPFTRSLQWIHSGVSLTHSIM